jgi:RNA polymerase sigma factor (sigma-70 family)
MDDALSLRLMTEEQNRRIAETVEREQSRLRNFIRKHVLNESDVEDILQEVFYELVQTYRLMKPLERVGAWLFRVARNHIIDRFRGRRQEAATVNPPGGSEQAEVFPWEDVLPSPDAGPEAAYARELLLEEIDAALDELPEEQREVFVVHEFEGRSFRELAAETGLSVNTCSPESIMRCSICGGACEPSTMNSGRREGTNHEN